jgi:hypothetical protein
VRSTAQTNNLITVVAVCRAALLSDPPGQLRLGRQPPALKNTIRPIAVKGRKVKNSFQNNNLSISSQS